jgi:light-regulated signal transduction histidine kinase (bacteriophytochrome)
MRNDLRLRNHTQEQLRKNNAELERRVLERTASIQRANADLERSKAELSAIANALKRSNIELESFAYAATHDLQEPLRTVTLFAQLLQEQAGTESKNAAAYYIETIIRAADRMSELIRGLLEYSRVSREPLEPVEQVDLNEVVSVVQENLSAQISESGAQITYSHLPVIAGSRLQVIRLMQNLIGNSVKYRSPLRTCKIDIHAERMRESWVISIRDNGIGFKTDYQEYIFGMFKRLDREQAGAGVGLATCQAIVERSGGRIWAEAEPGVGATFSFSWPAAESQVRAESRVASPRVFRAAGDA